MMMGKALQCGFLGMIFLASGTSALQCHSLNTIWSAVTKGDDWGESFTTLGSSALQCHSLNYIWTAFYKGHVGKAYTPLDKILNCSNACMEAQLKLSVAESVVLATYRGCADKEDKDVTTNNPHFNMQYNESFCSRDLCNNKMSTDYALNLNPGENTAPEKSGSNHCYAAITSDSKRNPKRVTCSKGYDQCYSGNANVTVGFISPIVIKTCSRPNFTESQNLSFGPIKFNLLGSSCLGSYCNGPKPDVTSHGK